MKYSGKIGFAVSKAEDDDPTNWKESYKEFEYFGDILRNNRRYTSSDKIVDDLEITNQFSILADEFMLRNFAHMRYLTYLGEKWKITSADIQYPRITISIGGIFHEQT